MGRWQTVQLSQSARGYNGDLCASAPVHRPAEEERHGHDGAPGVSHILRGGCKPCQSPHIIQKSTSSGQRLQYKMNERRAPEKVAETCYIESWISVDSAGGGMTVNLSRFHYEILKSKSK